MNAGSQLRRLAEFEHYLLDVSNRLIAAQLTDLDEEISAALARTISFWSLDGLFLYEQEADRAALRLVNSSVRPGLDDIPTDRERRVLEWSLPGMLSGRPTTITDFCREERDGQDESAQPEERVRPRSGISIPLKVENEVRGCMAIFGESRPGANLGDLLGVMTDLGEMLAGALERRRSGDLIYDHLQFEMLLSDISATYINIAPRDVEKVVRNHLGRLAQFFGANRCALYIFDEESGLFRTDTPLVWWPEEDDSFLKSLRQWFEGQPDMHPYFRYYFDKWQKG
jgi:hypothetical protein